MIKSLIALGALKVYLKWTAGWCTETAAQSGKTALIMGACKQPGYEIAEALAARDCRVIIADNDKLDSTRDRIIAATGNSKIVYKYVDFYKLQSVRMLAQDLIKNEPQLNTMIFSHHVSGLDRKPTEDGFLKVVQYNHLAPFLLTHELSDLLKKTPNSRVIFRSNILAYLHQIYSPADINRPPKNNNQFLHDLFQYSNTNALTLMTMMHFAEMLAEHNVSFCAVHPGFMDMTLFDISKDIEWKAMDAITALIYGKAIPSVLKLFGKSSLEGAQTSIYAAVTEKDIGGKFFADCKMITQPASAQMQVFRKRIFDETLRLVLATEPFAIPVKPSLKAEGEATVNVEALEQPLPVGPPISETEEKARTIVQTPNKS